MLAAILCLAVLLMLTSVGLAHPLRRVASAPTCSEGQQVMPDLKGLPLRSSPRVGAAGRLIERRYFSDIPNGPHTFAAFYITCDRLLEPMPFLVMDFRSSQYSLDGDRDGCEEATGLMSLPQIDPPDFYLAVDRADEFCDEDAISQR